MIIRSFMSTQRNCRSPSFFLTQTHNTALAREEEQKHILALRPAPPPTNHLSTKIYSATSASHRFFEICALSPLEMNITDSAQNPTSAAEQPKRIHTEPINVHHQSNGIPSNSNNSRSKGVPVPIARNKNSDLQGLDLMNASSLPSGEVSKMGSINNETSFGSAPRRRPLIVKSRSTFGSHKMPSLDVYKDEKLGFYPFTRGRKDSKNKETQSLLSKDKLVPIIKEPSKDEQGRGHGSEKQPLIQPGLDEKGKAKDNDEPHLGTSAAATTEAQTKSDTGLLISTSTPAGAPEEKKKKKKKKSKKKKKKKKKDKSTHSTSQAVRFPSLPFT